MHISWRSWKKKLIVYYISSEAKESTPTPATAPQAPKSKPVFGFASVVQAAKSVQGAKSAPKVVQGAQIGAKIVPGATNGAKEAPQGGKGVQGSPLQGAKVGQGAPAGAATSVAQAQGARPKQLGTVCSKSSLHLY